jgi:hypothetical protein
MAPGAVCACTRECCTLISRECCTLIFGREILTAGAEGRETWNALAGKTSHTMATVTTAASPTATDKFRITFSRKEFAGHSPVKSKQYSSSQN